MRSNISSASSILAEPDQSGKDWGPQNIPGYGNLQLMDGEEIHRNSAETGFAAGGERTIHGDRVAHRLPAHLCQKYRRVENLLLSEDRDSSEFFRPNLSQFLFE